MKQLAIHSKPFGYIIIIAVLSTFLVIGSATARTIISYNTAYAAGVNASSSATATTQINPYTSAMILLQDGISALQQDNDTSKALTHLKLAYQQLSSVGENSSTVQPTKILLQDGISALQQNNDVSKTLVYMKLAYQQLSAPSNTASLPSSSITPNPAPLSSSSSARIKSQTTPAQQTSLDQALQYVGSFIKGCIQNDVCRHVGEAGLCAAASFVGGVALCGHFVACLEGGVKLAGWYNDITSLINQPRQQPLPIPCDPNQDPNCLSSQSKPTICDPNQDPNCVRPQLITSTCPDGSQANAGQCPAATIPTVTKLPTTVTPQQQCIDNPAIGFTCPNPPPVQQSIICSDGSQSAADGSCPSSPDQNPTSPSPYSWLGSSHEGQKFT